jgi:hypothetical protein
MTDTVQAQAPKVSAEYIEKLLEACSLQIGQPPGTTSTFAHVFLPGGFYVATGHSACVSAENFDADKGVEYATKDAYQKARDKLWELEGYLLYAVLNNQKAGRTLQ